MLASPELKPGKPLLYDAVVPLEDVDTGWMPSSPCERAGNAPVLELRSLRPPLGLVRPLLLAVDEDIARCEPFRNDPLPEKARRRHEVVGGDGGAPIGGGSSGVSSDGLAFPCLWLLPRCDKLLERARAGGGKKFMGSSSATPAMKVVVWC